MVAPVLPGLILVWAAVLAWSVQALRATGWSILIELAPSLLMATTWVVGVTA